MPPAETVVVIGVCLPNGWRMASNRCSRNPANWFPAQANARGAPQLLRSDQPVGSPVPGPPWRVVRVCPRGGGGERAWIGESLAVVPGRAVGQLGFDPFRKL